MQQIGQILQGLTASSDRQNMQKQCELSLVGSARQEDMQMKFLARHNPSEQAIVCQDEDDCINGHHLTLVEIDKIYGSNFAQTWLIPQLANLSEFCGCKEKITQDQIIELSWVIRQNFGWLKTTELMLFFSWMKGGRFGKLFYGSVDPMVIMSTLQKFCIERSFYIDRHEQELRLNAKEEHERLHPRMTIREYERQYGKLKSFGLINSKT